MNMQVRQSVVFQAAALGGLFAACGERAPVDLGGGVEKIERAQTAAGRGRGGDLGKEIIREEREPEVLVATRLYAPDSFSDGVLEWPKTRVLELPGYLSVTAGNAGNGTASLYFLNHQGARFRCDYVGTSASQHPAPGIEYAKGLRYTFAACYQLASPSKPGGVRVGWKPGKAVPATRVTLHVASGDSQSGPTRVEWSPAGETGCSAQMAEFMSPEETARARAAFSWSSTQALPETDSSGRPTLWYARIYVRDLSEFDAIGELLIHHSPTPIFTAELGGRRLCGNFTPRGDGEGVFTYVVIPGITYNLLRQYALTPDDEGNDRTIFQVIDILTPPAGARNADRSLSYEGMGQTGFKYVVRGAADGGEPEEQPVSQPILGRIRRFVVNAVRTVVGGAVEGAQWLLGQANTLVLPTRTLTFDIDVLNLDPAFDRNAPVTRGWGAKAGQEAVLRGAEFVMAFRSPFTALAWYRAPINEQGIVRVRVPTLPLAYMYIEKQNQASRVFSSPIVDRHYTGIFYDDLILPSTRDRSFRWRVRDEEMHGMVQFTDSYDYMHAMTGRRPERADVLAGPIAWAITAPSGGRAFAPCFGFSNVVYDGILVGLVAALGPLGAALLPDADIVMPPGRSLESRVTSTHEYGHFAFCNMVHWEGAWNTVSALSRITWAYVTSGFEEGPEDQERYLFEGFADFFSGQVAAGMSYTRPIQASRRDSLNSTLCVKAPCLEENLVRDSTFIGRQSWAATLFHDAFDGHDAPLPVPTDADFWAPVGSALQYSPARYGDSCGKTAHGNRNANLCDERVALQGPHLRFWVQNWLRRGPNLTEGNFVRALADTVRGTEIELNDWCRACELFAAHTPTLSRRPVERGNMRYPPSDYWQVCTSDPQLSTWIPFPPGISSLAIDARTCQPCPHGYYSPPGSQTGACEPCAGANDIVRDNQCEACRGEGSVRTDRRDRCLCGPRQRNDAAGNCEPCPAGQIGTGPPYARTCTPCPSGTTPVPGEDRCTCAAHHVPDPQIRGQCVACPEGHIALDGACLACTGGRRPMPNRNLCACPDPLQVCVPDDVAGMCICQRTCPAQFRVDPFGVCTRGLEGIGF